MSELNKCLHLPCTCEAMPGADFCSEVCKEAKEGGQTDCACPHDGCAGVPVVSSEADLLLLAPGVLAPA